MEETIYDEKTNSTKAGKKSTKVIETAQQISDNGYYVKKERMKQANSEKAAIGNSTQTSKMGSYTKSVERATRTKGNTNQTETFERSTGAYVKRQKGILNKSVYYNNDITEQKNLNNIQPNSNTTTQPQDNASRIISIKTGTETINDINTKTANVYANNNATETINLDNETMNTQKINVENIDLNRIAASAQNALNSNFSNVNKDIWKKADLNVTKREDGTYLIRNGNIPLGFTDEKGLLTLTNLEEKTNTITEEKTPEKKSQARIEEIPTTTSTNGYNGGGFTLESGEKLETVYKIIAAEGGNISPGEAVNIASTMINRARSGRWGSTDIYKLATAPNQYVVYQEGIYKNKTLNAASRAAVDELFESCAAGGETPHNYESFRSNGSTGYGGTILEPGGNRYK